MIQRNNRYIGCVMRAFRGRTMYQNNRNQIDVKSTYRLNLGPALRRANVQFAYLKLLHGQSAVVYTRLSLSLYHACLSVCLSVCACVATASVTGIIRRRRNAFSSCLPVHKNSGTSKPSNTTFCFCRRCQQSSSECCCGQ